MSEGAHMGVATLLSRERSSMASTWREYLGIEQLSENCWRLGTYRHDWLSLDCIPESQRYDEFGEVVVPVEVNGRKIIGLADGDFLETDELVVDSYIDVVSGDAEAAQAYCNAQDWERASDFCTAWLRIYSCICSANPLSLASVLVGSPILRGALDPGNSRKGTHEVIVVFDRSTTEVWTWSLESGGKCLSSSGRRQSFREVIEILLERLQESDRVDLESAEVSSLAAPESTLLALACSSDSTARVAAGILVKAPESVLSPLIQDGPDLLSKLVSIGQRVASTLEERHLSLADLGAVRLRDVPTLDVLADRLVAAVRRRDQSRSKSDDLRARNLEPHREEIERLVHAFAKDRPVRRLWRGAGPTAPPLGVVSLRAYLTRYALKHGHLPSGTVTVPYVSEDKSSSKGFFTVDIEGLH